MPLLPYKAFGVCRLLTRGCFWCGSTDHLIAQCPRESGDNRSLQESGRGKSVTLPLTRDRGRVEVARFGIVDEEAQSLRQWIVLYLQHQHEHML